MAFRPQTTLLCWFSLLLALCLQVMPLPDVWLIWRPQWLGLMLVYWCIVSPQSVGVFHGFLFGLALDVLQGAPLGHNALVLSLTAFMGVLLYQRIRAYSLLQQALLVIVVLGIAQLVDQWLRSIFGAGPVSLSFLLSAVIGGALWPWLYTLLQILRRRLTA